MKKSILLFLSVLFAAMFIFSSCAKSNELPPTEEDLSYDANQFIEELAENDYSGAIKNHNYGLIMRLLTGKKTLKVIWESLITQYGNYVAVYEYEYNQQSGYDNIIIKVAFENQCIDFKVTYDESTLNISGLHYYANADNPTLAGAPSPTLPDNITESSFSFNSDGFEIPAILTLPDGEGPHPIVILVHGSGPNNANESIGNQAPFRDIAWGLAQQGIAVLRYDKRTLVYPDSWNEDATVEQETINDAIAASISAQKIPEVNPDQIFILGHSLGAMLIPKISDFAPDIAGFVMMATPTTPLHKLMVEQYDYLFNLDGKLTINERISLYQAKNMSRNVDNLTEDSNKKSSKLFNISKAYWLYLKDYDVIESTKAIQRPLLIIQGESDYQVPMHDFEALKGALKTNRNVSLISYPNLGHLMTSAGNPPSPDDYYNKLTVDPQVIDDIASFITSN